MGTPTATTPGASVPSAGPPPHEIVGDPRTRTLDIRQVHTGLQGKYLDMFWRSESEASHLGPLPAPVHVPLGRSGRT